MFLINCILNLSAFIVREREDENGVRKSKGYGFITYENKDSADQAIQAMHETVSLCYTYIMKIRKLQSW